ncbi:hypothetical protein DSECCO2_645340 [anaerobic digester metagenome]
MSNGSLVLKQRLSNLSNKSWKSIGSFSSSKNKSAILLLTADSCNCSLVLLGFKTAFMAPLQLLHSICFSKGPQPECLLKALKGKIRVQTLHCFQYDSGCSVAIRKNPSQNLKAVVESALLYSSSQFSKGKSVSFE